MKFKDYTQNLTELLKQRPELADLSVVSSIDAEGNGYNLVHYTPSLGQYEGGDFEPEDIEKAQDINAVCIN